MNKNRTICEGWIAGKRGHLWCEQDETNKESGWFDIKIGSYYSAEEQKKERGMYFFTMVDKRNGNEVPWTDYFSDDDETVMVDGLRGKKLWKQI